MRESAEAKGARYLLEHRLTILAVNEHEIRAVARGSGEVYDCGLEGGRWHCSCPAKTVNCSHLFALRSVTVVPRSRP